LGSLNGTLLNGRPIQEAQVLPGDAVRVGKATLRFVSEEEQARPAEQAVMPVLEATPAVPPATATPSPSEDLRLETEKKPAGLDIPLPPPADADLAAVPNAPGYAEDDEATPVDLSTQPPMMANALALVPVGQAGPPAVAEAAAPPSGPTGGRFLASLSPRMRLLIVAIVAATLLGVVVIMAHRARMQRVRDANRLPIATYNSYIDRAVEIFREGKLEDAAVLLQKVAQAGTEGNRKTADIFREALLAEQKVQKDFAKNWERGQERWEELLKDSASTPRARELAQERFDRVQREAGNMTRFQKAEAAFKAGDFPAFFAAAEKVNEDSMFRPAIREMFAKAQAEVVKSYTAKADQAEQALKWTEAVDALQTVLKYAPAMAEHLKPRIEKLQTYETQRKDLAKASALLDQGQVDQARTILRSLAQNSPYREQAEAELERAKKIEAQAAATQLFDAGQGDKAMERLKTLGLETDTLARRIKSVMELHESMESAIESVEFARAKTFAAQIQQLEKNPRNWYRLRADSLLGGVEAMRQKKAQELAESAKAAHAKGEFNRARALVDEASMIDPASVEAVNFRSVLKKEAQREFNRALQLRDNNPQEALKIFEEALARLRPKDTFYTRTQDAIRECKEKLKAPAQ
jgi:hypothetical protein